MATYNAGITGPFSGKIGGVIASNWRKVTYFRSQGTTSKKPASIEQLTQRAKLALCSSFLSPIKDVLRVGYSDKKLGKLSGYNAAARMFLATAITGSYPDFAVDFSSLRLSKGSLAAALGLAMQEADGELTITWKSIVNKYNSFKDDKLMVVVFNETKHMYFIFDTSSREDETFTMETGTDFNGDTLHVWAFMVKRDDSVAAPSQYLGAITVS